MQENKIEAVLLTDTHLFEKKSKQDALIDCNFDTVFDSFVQAIELAKKHGLKRVFHGGDLFDSRKNQSQSLLEMFDQILQLFSENNIELVLVAGNHDKTSYRHEYSFLFPYRHHPNLHLVSKYDYIDEAKIRFHFLAYFDNDIYTDILKNIAIPNIDPTVKNVLITHIGIHGALNNDHEKDESSITFKMFEDFDKVLIGHYHQYSSFVKDKIMYVGSAFQHNFGEDNRKGILLLDSNLRLQRVKTKFKEYKTIEIDIKDIQKTDIDDLVLNQMDEYQRVVITGEESLIRSFDRSKLTDFGVKVVVKSDPIVLQEVEQKLDSHDTASIFTNFSNFCKANSHVEAEGLLYLKKAI